MNHDARTRSLDATTALRLRMVDRLLAGDLLLQNIGLIRARFECLETSVTLADIFGAVSKAGDIALDNAGWASSEFGR